MDRGGGERALLTAGLAQAAAFLRCPHCGAPLALRAGTPALGAGTPALGAGTPALGAGTPALGAGTLACANGHSFDVARQGYVNLAHGRAPVRGDTAAMVAARAEFLDAGHFDALVEAVVREARAELSWSAAPAHGAQPEGVAPAAPARSPGCAPEEPGAARCVVDVGAGTGKLLASVLDGVADAAGVALDSSTFAARRAARAHPRIGAVVCDVWRGLPLRDGVAALVVNAFAPRNGAEIARVLAPDGTLLVVSPTQRHLGELVGPLGLLSVDERKPQRLGDTLDPHLEAVREGACEFTMSLGRNDVARVVAMGPSAHHVRADLLAQGIAALPQRLSVTASATIAVYRPRATPARAPARAPATATVQPPGTSIATATGATPADGRAGGPLSPPA